MGCATLRRRAGRGAVAASVSNPTDLVYGGRSHLINRAAAAVRRRGTQGGERWLPDIPMGDGGSSGDAPEVRQPADLKQLAVTTDCFSLVRRVCDDRLQPRSVLSSEWCVPACWFYLLIPSRVTEICKPQWAGKGRLFGIWRVRLFWWKRGRVQDVVSDCNNRCTVCSCSACFTSLHSSTGLLWRLLWSLWENRAPSGREAPRAAVHSSPLGAWRVTRGGGCGCPPGCAYSISPRVCRSAVVPVWEQPCTRQ